MLKFNPFITASRYSYSPYLNTSYVKVQSLKTQQLQLKKVFKYILC